MLRLRRRGRQAGVTMVEMMTVCGIMATLAGQSGSAFMQVQNKSLGTACQHNLKQIYLALQMSAMDNDGQLPVAWFFPWKRTTTGELDPSDPYNIANIVAGRDGSVRKLFICPAAPELWQKLGLTYVYNDTVGGKLLDGIPNPSMTWLMMDANVMSQQQFPPPHLGGYNVLFCDGRVKWVPKAAIPTIWRPPVQPPQDQ